MPDGDFGLSHMAGSGDFQASPSPQWTPTNFNPPPRGDGRGSGGEEAPNVVI